MRMIRRLSALCLTVFLLLTLLPATALAASPSVHWAGAFSSENNNPVTTVKIPTEASKIQKAWDAPVGNGSVAIVDNYVYTYNGVSGGGVKNEGTFYKVDKTTGEIKGTIVCGVDTGNYYSYTIYAGGKLYVSCPKAILCFDPETFTKEWQTNLRSEHIFATVQYVNGFLVANGEVLNASTGAAVTILPGSYSWANGVEVGGCYYVAANGTLYAFETTNWTQTDSITFTGSGAGVLYHNGRLYWGCKDQPKLYSVAVNSGVIDDETKVEVNCGYTAYAAPAALGGRIYLPGTQVNDTTVGTGLGAVCVYTTETLKPVYDALLTGSGHKLQASPILRMATSGGNVVAGGDAALLADPAAATTTAYLYVQDYASPSSIYVLEDTDGKTSGALEKLVSIDPPDYAFEQMAVDNQGAIYCSNDAGYLVKYVKTETQVPTIGTNLSVEEVVYNLKTAAATLGITASVTDGGTLSYQWESHDGNGIFEKIPNATANTYTPDTTAVGTTFYRCVVTNTVSGSTARAYSRIAKITVCRSGDVNEDGTVLQSDVTALRRYLAKYDEPISTAAADVNRDGTVNLRDLVILRRHLAGWGYSLG